MENRLASEIYDELDSSGAVALYSFATCPTRHDRNGPYHKEDVVAALMRSDFVLIATAVLLGRSRTRLKEYIMKQPDLVELVNDHMQGVIDKSERVVIKSALAGESADARFILTTLGKDRGYTTRAETTGANGAPIEIMEASAKQAMGRLEKLIVSVAAEAAPAE